MDFIGPYSHSSLTTSGKNTIVVVPALTKGTEMKKEEKPVGELNFTKAKRLGLIEDNRPIIPGFEREEKPTRRTKHSRKFATPDQIRRGVK